MNITKIISQGIYHNLGACLKLTINFKQQAITGYDIKGRPIYAMNDKKQVFYGITKGECKAKARQMLTVELYERKRLVFHAQHQTHYADGCGVFI